MIIELAFIFLLGVAVGMKFRDFLNTLVIHRAQKIVEEEAKKGKRG